MEARKLSAGQRYDVNSLEFAFWIDSHYCKVDIAGYDVFSFFDDGVFLGADDDGIQPVFSRRSIVAA